MAVQTSIEEFLEQRQIPFTTFTHRPAFTAQEQAAVSHVPGWNWAKTVVCMADGQPILSVLPAPYVIDFEQLRQLVGAEKVRLATEDEMARLYPGCEVGATPPLGPLYDQRVFVEQGLVGGPDLVFDAGSHTKAIRMRFSDFTEVARPIVGSFGRLPEPRPATSRDRTKRATPPLF